MLSALKGTRERKCNITRKWGGGGRKSVYDIDKGKSVIY